MIGSDAKRHVPQCTAFPQVSWDTPQGACSAAHVEIPQEPEPASDVGRPAAEIGPASWAESPQASPATERSAPISAAIQERTTSLREWLIRQVPLVRVVSH
jgi:hypothetical protein